MTSHQSASSSTSWFIQVSSLVLLTAHNTAVTLLMRYSRSRKSTASSPLYLTSVTVLVVECIKLLCSLTLVLAVDNKWQFSETVGDLRRQVIRKPHVTMRVGIPALLYAIQNNLVFIAVSNLDAAIFQVSSQLRLFTTALLSVAMLKKQLSEQQWAALGLLFCGVSIVQVSSLTSNNNNNAPSGENHFIGMAAVLSACCLSGAASVYFEKMLKLKPGVSIWIRNVQLSAISIPIALVGVMLSSWPEIRRDGFLQGFDALVWFIAAMQSVGGLLIAFVVKNTDSIMKGFAMSGSVIFSVALARLIFETPLSIHFLIGALAVIVAVFLYTAYPFTSDAKITIDADNVPIVDSTRIIASSSSDAIENK